MTAERRPYLVGVTSEGTAAGVLGPFADGEVQAAVRGDAVLRDEGADVVWTTLAASPDDAKARVLRAVAEAAVARGLATP